MCEDNSRFHSNCVWVDRPCGGASAGVVGMHSRSSGPRNSSKLRKYCSRRCNASAMRRRSSCVYQLKTGSYFGPKFRPGVSDPRAQATLDLRPLDHAERCRPMSRSYVQRHQQPALAAMTPARRLRMFRVAAAPALIKLPERRHRQARKPRGSNESLRVCSRTTVRRPTEQVPPLPAHRRSARGRRRYRKMALADSRQQPIQIRATDGSPRFRNCSRERG